MSDMRPSRGQPGICNGVSMSVTPVSRHCKLNLAIKRRCFSCCKISYAIWLVQAPAGRPSPRYRNFCLCFTNLLHSTNLLLPAGDTTSSDMISRELRNSYIWSVCFQSIEVSRTYEEGSGLCNLVSSSLHKYSIYTMKKLASRLTISRSTRG